MPIVGFKGLDGEQISIEDAPNYFDNMGIVPAELVQRICQRDVDHGANPYISPSLLNAGTICMRDVLIARFLPFYQDPQKRWMAYEGNAFHDAFVHGLPAGDWLHEVAFPADPDIEGWQPEHGDDRKHPKVRRCDEDGKLRYELMPGIWVRGKVDRVRRDTWQDITDLKTKKPSRTDYGLRDMRGWSKQVNAYRVMVEDLKGVTVENCWVWRLYRGARSAKSALRRFPVPQLTPDFLPDLEAHARTLVGHLQACYAMGDDQAAIAAYIHNLPLQGLKMFVNRDKTSNKCINYCDVNDKCLGEIEAGESVPVF